MIWKSKYMPNYIFLDDEWERLPDHKIFKPILKYRVWRAKDGEEINWTKHSQVMKGFEYGDAAYWSRFGGANQAAREKRNALAAADGRRADESAGQGSGGEG
jgi:hypothetical protein